MENLVPTIKIEVQNNKYSRKLFGYLLSSIRSEIQDCELMQSLSEPGSVMETEAIEMMDCARQVYVQIEKFLTEELEGPL